MVERKVFISARAPIYASDAGAQVVEAHGGELVDRRAIMTRDFEELLFLFKIPEQHARHVRDELVFKCGFSEAKLKAVRVTAAS